MRTDPPMTELLRELANDPLLGVLIDGLIKGLIFALVMFLLFMLIKRRPAHLRRLFWNVAFVGLLLIPLVSLLAPAAVNIPLFPSSGANPAYSEQPTTEAGEQDGMMAASNRPTDTLAALGLNQGKNSPIAARKNAAAIGMSALLFWLCGSIVLSIVYLIRFAAFHFRYVKSRCVDRPALLRILESARKDLGVSRHVGLRMSEALKMPILKGILKPEIILPTAVALSPQDCKVIIHHELVHVKRSDNFIHVLSLLASIIHWCNPLVWLARRQLTEARELACDEEVLQGGIRLSDYAQSLLNVFKGDRYAPAFGMSILSFAQCSTIKKRFDAMFNSTSKSEGKSRFTYVVVTMALLFSILLTGLSFSVSAHREIDMKEVSIAHVSSAEDAEIIAVPDEVERLIKRVNNTSRLDVLEKTIRKLGRLRDKRATSALLPFLDHPNDNIRASAAWAISEFKDPRAVDELLSKLADDYPQVRIHAARALGDIPSARIVVGYLNEMLLNEPLAKVRVHVAHAIGDLADLASEDAIRTALIDPDPRVRKKARWALREIEEKQGLHP